MGEMGPDLVRMSSHLVQIRPGLVQMAQISPKLVQMGPDLVKWTESSQNGPNLVHMDQICLTWSGPGSNETGSGPNEPNLDW